MRFLKRKCVSMTGSPEKAGEALPILTGIAANEHWLYCKITSFMTSRKTCLEISRITAYRLPVSIAYWRPPNTLHNCLSLQRLNWYGKSSYESVSALSYQPFMSMSASPFLFKPIQNYLFLHTLDGENIEVRWEWLSACYVRADDLKCTNGSYVWYGKVKIFALKFCTLKVMDSVMRSPCPGLCSPAQGFQSIVGCIT